MIATLRNAPFLLLAGLAIAILASVSAVATLAVSTTTTSVVFNEQQLQNDAGVSQTAATITKASATVSSNTSAGGELEVTNALPVARTAITANDWVYQVVVQEASANSWNASNVYKVEVYGDGALKGTVYIKNVTDAAAVEGATVQVSLGSGALPDKISVKVERTA